MNKKLENEFHDLLVKSLQSSLTEIEQKRYDFLSQKRSAKIDRKEASQTEILRYINNKIRELLNKL